MYPAMTIGSGNFDSEAQSTRQDVRCRQPLAWVFVAAIQGPVWSILRMPKQRPLTYRRSYELEWLPRLSRHRLF